MSSAAAAAAVITCYSWCSSTIGTYSTITTSTS